MRKSTATIRDVAREAGVSVASASRALNGHVNVTAATRQRILAAADKLDYIPHVGARSLTMARTNAIGVVLPDLFGEFFSEVIRGIDRGAHRAGLQLLLANMHGDAQETAAAIRAMRGRVDGLLVMSPEIELTFLNQHLPRNLPTVVLNRQIVDSHYGSIAIDNVSGARAIVAHLISQGYRRIAHIAGPPDNSDARERLDGFRAAMAEMMGERDPVVLPGNFSDLSGRAAAERWLAGEFAADAIFAANDMSAVGCLNLLEERGVPVPARVAVAGFDDIPIARYVTPGLTTMRVHIADFGTRAFELLAAIIADPDAPPPPGEVMVPELVVRRSTLRCA